MNPHRRYAVAFLLLSVAVELVACQSTFGGWITESFTLDVSGSPYVVNSNIVIDRNVTLTIQPGVELRFEPGVSVVVKGSLLANGSKTQRITFTATQPILSRYVPCSWNGITWEEDADSLTEVVDFLSTTRSKSILSYVDVSKAGALFDDSSGDGTLQYRHKGPALSAVGIAPPLDNVRVINNFGPGVKWKDISMTAEIHDCEISSNTIYGLGFTSNGIGRLQIDGCVVYGNDGDGVSATFTKPDTSLDFLHYSLCSFSMEIDDNTFLDHTEDDISDGSLQCKQVFKDKMISKYAFVILIF